MTVRQTISPYKAEYLLRDGAPEKNVEIVDGELIVSEPAGWYHNRIADNLLLQLRAFCEERNDLNCCSQNNGFLLRRDPDLLYSPDAALFVRRPYPPADQPWMEFCPEMAVEILSPANSAAEIAHKCHDYFDAGAEQVWIIDPTKKLADIRFRDGRRLLADSGDSIQGEGIAHGLTVDIKSLFEV